MTTNPRARPGGPGEHQRAEARQGKVGRMPSLAVNKRARPGGPGQHQRAEARQGKVGTMPSLAVKRQPNHTRGISKPSRGFLAANAAAWSSPTIFCVAGSHLIVRPSLAAIAARWQVFIAMMWL